MRIKLAETAGFCMGVRRALNTVLELVQNQSGPIYTLGPLVHNPQVIELLEARGVHVIGEGDLDKLTGGTVVIRAHGVTPEVASRLAERGLTVVDATCPRVHSIQNIIEKHTAAGGSVIIVGDRGHAETTGLAGYAGAHGIVIETPDEVDALPPLDNIIVVSQTTQDVHNFQEAARRIAEKYPSAVVKDTICGSTHRRQDEARQLASEVRCMVVVGGRNSANTRRLAEICSQFGTRTLAIEDPAELTVADLDDYDTVGLTAGASTPNWMISRVIERLHRLARQRYAAPVRWLIGAGETLVQMNLLILFGAFCLAYATVRLQRLPLSQTSVWLSCVVAGLYLLGMHIYNHFDDQRQRPFRGWFGGGNHSRWRSQLTGMLGIVATVAAIGGSVALGWQCFAVLVLMTAAGILYRVPIMRLLRGPQSPQRRLSDIPGSKDLFTAFAWGIVVVLLPRLARSTLEAAPTDVAAPVLLPTVVTFCFVMVLVFSRSVLLDVRDMQTDRIVGLETIPMLIGKDQTKIILNVLLAATAALLVAGTRWWGVTAPMGYWMVGCIAYTAGYLYFYHKRTLYRDLTCRVASTSTFVLAGLIAWVCWTFRG